MSKAAYVIITPARNEIEQVQKDIGSFAAGRDTRLLEEMALAVRKGL